MVKFPFYLQPDIMDCGPTCIRMVAKHYGKSYSLPYLRRMSQTTRQGSSMLGMSEAAEKIGLHSLGVKVPFALLQKEVPLPCIAHWNQNHFVVVYKISVTYRLFGKPQTRVHLADPGHGLLSYTREEFIQNWAGENGTEGPEGILLLLEPTPAFYTHEEETNPEEIPGKSGGIRALLPYFFRYKKIALQILTGLAGAALLQLALPFLTQSIVDTGIRNRDIHFVWLILLAQLLLFTGRTVLDIIRQQLLMHLSSRVNMAMVSDFFAKLMRLPASYFDVKLTGDIMQRISDQQRIEQFLTGSGLNTAFSLLNLLVLSGVMYVYHPPIFFLFLAGSLLYALWMSLFLKKRRDLDYKRFAKQGANQSQVVEMIHGMQEIKLHNAELSLRWAWEKLQVKIFNLNLQSLKLEQWQQSGSGLINELKNMLITVAAAMAVIKGDMTLGMMLSVSYIAGQLNAPVLQLVDLLRGYQDAKISAERLDEIRNKPDETDPRLTENHVTLPERKNIQLSGISFRYEGAGNENVLNNLDLEIPEGKITAIVGSSGSGKTTLLKLLLRFYEPTEGRIKVGPTDLKFIPHGYWRSCCGTVMQEGYIFSDTIAGNIAPGEDAPDPAKLAEAAKLANINEFIEQLPLAYQTKIGREGIGLSTGQKQRILIARAVYKNPLFLFFDEATSALDAKNENEISKNLENFYQGKTVVIIAHRLSTVKNAHQIVVLEKGKIMETGTHAGLVNQKGAYWNLVKNQLELGA